MNPTKSLAALFAALYGQGALNWAQIGNAQEAYRLAALAARYAFFVLDGSENGSVFARAGWVRCALVSGR